MENHVNVNEIGVLNGIGLFFNKIIQKHQNSALLYTHNLLCGIMRADALLKVSSASFSILETRTLHVGMSWIRPITCPAVHT